MTFVLNARCQKTRRITDFIIKIGFRHDKKYTVNHNPCSFIQKISLYWLTLRPIHFGYSQFSIISGLSDFFLGISKNIS